MTQNQPFVRHERVVFADINPQGVYNLFRQIILDSGVRTRCFAGSKDMIKDSHTRLIVAQIPNSELQIIPGNHFIANKEPEMFNEVGLRFLVR